MAVKYSTRAQALIMGRAITVTDAGSQISFAVGTSTITTTQSDFLTQGFRPGQSITVTNANNATNNDEFVISSVTATTIVVTGTLADEAAALGTPTIALVNGLNWPLMFKDGILVIYSSPMPANADLLETGTLLAELTLSGATFTAGATAGGLEIEHSATTDGVFGIKSGEAWQDSTPNAAGTAYYAILYDNGYITGLDSTNKQSPRIMGTVGVSGSGRDFIISSTSIVTTVPVTCTQFQGTQASEACS